MGKFDVPVLPAVRKHDTNPEAHAALIELNNAPMINITKKFGVVPDGVDRSSEMTDALNNTPTAARLFIDTSDQPGGTGVLKLTDVDIGDFAVGSGRQLELLAISRTCWLQAGDPDLPAITVKGDSRIPSTYFRIKGLAAEFTADRAYDPEKALVRIQQIRNWEIADTHFRSNSHTGQFVDFDGSYEGHWHDSYGYMDRFAVPFRWATRMDQPNSSPSKPPQADTCLFERVTWMGLCGGIFEDAGNEAHGLAFDAYKVVNNTSDIATPRVESKVTANAAKGATTIQMLNTDIIVSQTIGTTRDDSAAYGTSARSGIKVNDQVLIGQGGSLQVNKVAAWAPTGVDGTHGILTLAQPLIAAIDLAVKDAAVRVYGVGIAMGIISSVDTALCHFEQQSVALDTAGTQNMTSRLTHCSCHEHVRICGNSQRIKVIKPRQFGTNCENVVFFRDSRISNDVVNGNFPNYFEVEGPVSTPPGVSISAKEFATEVGATGALGSFDTRRQHTLSNHIQDLINHGATSGAKTAAGSFAHAVSRGGSYSNPSAGWTSNGRVVASEVFTTMLKRGAGVAAAASTDLSDGINMADPDGNILALAFFSLDTTTGQFLFWASYDGGTSWKSVELS